MRKNKNIEDSFTGNIDEIDDEFFYVIMYKDNADNEIKYTGKFPISCLKPGQKRFLKLGWRLFLTTYKKPINKRGDTSKIRFMNIRWTKEQQENALAEAKKWAEEMVKKLHWE